MNLSIDFSKYLMISISFISGSIGGGLTGGNKFNQGFSSGNSLIGSSGLTSGGTGLSSSSLNLGGGNKGGLNNQNFGGSSQSFSSSGLGSASGLGGSQSFSSGSLGNTGSVLGGDYQGAVASFGGNNGRGIAFSTDGGKSSAFLYVFISYQFI